MPLKFELGDDFDAFIESMVATGRYNDASEVVREGLRLLEDKQREQEKDEAEIEAFLAESFADIEAGRVRPAEDVFDDLKRMLRERRGEAAE